MILLLESHAGIRKKLCDLLNKERIIGIDSAVRIFEMVCKYKKDINVIISSISLINNITSNKILLKLCQKLAIETPPILCFYTTKYEKIKQSHEKENREIKYIEFDIADKTFPEKFINILQQMYPELSADLKRAVESWLDDTEYQDPINLQKWLVEQGFLQQSEKDHVQHIQELRHPHTASDEEIDYKQLYFDLKTKYDKLCK